MATTSAGPPVSPSWNEPCRLRTELERLRDEAIRQKDLAHRRADFWVKVDIALGFPAALLAGASGAAGLASVDARIPAALLALIAAGCAAGAGFLRGDSRRVANKRARQAWAAVEAAARMKLAKERAVLEDLGEVLAGRQLALAAYEGEDSQPGASPGIPGR
ncbi:hypothetical protein [Streptomyces sp. NPDC048637]|uniref:hypothetical protein n=1 Tax=Streptomyces sp. NPDC048637 TaxID=3155636 RepID=UPI00341464F3